MEFDEYQRLAARTGYGPDKDKSFVLMIHSMGLAGETGEVIEKLKHVMRDEGGVVSEEKRQLLKKEMGDVLWYLSELARTLGFSFDEIATLNIKKLEDRAKRGMIGGEGDLR